MQRSLLEMDLTSSTELHFIYVRSRSELVDAASGSILPTFFTLSFLVSIFYLNFLSIVAGYIDTLLDSDALLFGSETPAACALP